MELQPREGLIRYVTFGVMTLGVLLVLSAVTGSASLPQVALVGAAAFRLHQDPSSLVLMLMSIAFLGIVATYLRPDLANGLDNLLSHLPINLGRIDGNRLLRMCLAGVIVFGWTLQRLPHNTPAPIAIILAILSGFTISVALFILADWLLGHGYNHGFQLEQLIKRVGVVVSDGKSTSIPRVLISKGPIVGIWPVDPSNTKELQPGSKVVVVGVNGRTLQVKVAEQTSHRHILGFSRRNSGPTSNVPSNTVLDDFEDI